MHTYVYIHIQIVLRIVWKRTYGNQHTHTHSHSKEKQQIQCDVYDVLVNIIYSNLMTPFWAKTMEDILRSPVLFFGWGCCSCNSVPLWTAVEVQCIGAAGESCWASIHCGLEPQIPDLCPVERLASKLHFQSGKTPSFSCQSQSQCRWGFLMVVR